MFQNVLIFGNQNIIIERSIRYNDAIKKIPPPCQRDGLAENRIEILVANSDTNAVGQVRDDIMRGMPHSLDFVKLL